jgi:hypothetical protein
MDWFAKRDYTVTQDQRELHGTFTPMSAACRSLNQIQIGKRGESFAACNRLIQSRQGDGGLDLHTSWRFDSGLAEESTLPGLIPDC